MFFQWEEMFHGAQMIVEGIPTLSQTTIVNSVILEIECLQYHSQFWYQALPDSFSVGIKVYYTEASQSTE